MIIRFSASVEELISTPKNKLEEFINDLMTSSVKGHHLVVVDSHVGEWLLENLSLMDRSIGKLTAIIQSRATRSSIIKSAPFLLDINLHDVPLYKSAEGFYSIGYVALMKSEILQKPYFAVENSRNDGRLFGEIFDAMKNMHPVSVLSYELEMGGGSTLSAVFEDKLKNKRVMVALADGDKRHPTAGDSDLLNTMLEHAEQQVFVGDVFSLPCRDSENLLPLQIFQLSDLCDDFKSSHMDKLLDLENPESVDCPILYFDMKEGIKLEKYAKLATGSPELAWIDKNFADSPTGAMDKSFPGLGQKVLANFLDKQKLVGKFHEWIKTSKWRKIFYDFFGNLRWYFAAEKIHSTA